MSDYYVLNDDHTVRPVGTHEWATAFEGRDKRRVDLTKVGGGTVSTVFLGLDHSYGEGPPLIFETMTFDIGEGENCWRYSTWDQAVAGHDKVVKHIAAGLPLEGFKP